MANTKIKIVVSTLFVVGLIILAYYLIFVKFVFWGKLFDPKSDRYKIEEIAEKRKIQYRMSYTHSGNLTQTIHLNKGPSLFVFYHEGTGKFRAELKTTSDSLIKVLADELGEFEAVVEAEAPETDAYLLDVKTSGKWGLAYK